jgi:hypothetical protein
MTSQNIDFSSWDTLYIQEPYTKIPFRKNKDKAVTVLS